MTQILKSLQLPITGSTPAAPPLGFGSVYASSSNKFYFKNSVGTEFDLVTTNGYINTLYYTGSTIGDGTAKTYTWSPTFTGLKYIEVCCVGAGGGGGSGRKSTLGPTFKTLGGMGGGGGAVVWTTFEASILDSSYNISIGAGGAGGIGQTTNNTNGNNGTNGGTSSFGTLVVARGGFGGAGGTTGGNITTAGGRALQCIPAGIPYAINGCTTSRLSAQAPGAPNNASIALAVNQNPPIFFPGAWLNSLDPVLGSLTAGFGGGAGGYGGAYNPNLPEITSASRGSNGYQFDTLVVNSGVIGSGGTVNGGNATSPTDNMITTLLQFTGSTTLYGLGGGGHGGGAGLTGNGGNGSNGGLYGAGGGGGGACYNNTALSSSGAGASGSSGLCIVIEFY